MGKASISSQPRNGGRLFGGGHLRRGVRALTIGAALLLAAPAFGKGNPAEPMSSVDSIVAQANGKSVAIYRSPYAKTPFMHVASPNADGAPAVFLVKSRAPGWEEVFLAKRPNGSTGWVKDSQVSLALDPYRVQVSLSGHRVTVWKGDTVVDNEIAGVGAQLAR